MEEIENGVETKWKRAAFTTNEVLTDDDIEEDIEEDSSNKIVDKFQECSDSSDIPEELEYEEEVSDEEIPERIVIEEN